MEIPLQITDQSIEWLSHHHHHHHDAKRCVISNTQNEKKATDLRIEILLRGEDRIVEQQLQSFLHVVVTEIFKCGSSRSAAVRGISKAGSIDNKNGRHRAIV